MIDGSADRTAAGDEPESGLAERRRLTEVYGRYFEPNGRSHRWNAHSPGNRLIEAERTRRLVAQCAALDLRDGDVVLDVGCGDGRAVAEFTEALATVMGIELHPVGAELLGRPAAAGTESVSRLLADGRKLPLADGAVSLALLFTVASSMPERSSVAELGAEVSRVLRPGGAVVWYDMRRPSPVNPDVRPVGVAEIAAAFGSLEVNLETLTVLPPVARRLGPLTSPGYRVLSRFPVLRTHLGGVLVRR